MNMNKSKYIVVLLSAGLLVCSTGCKEKDLYDPEKVKEINEQLAPIGEVDPAHNWKTTGKATISVQATIGGVDVQRVYILSKEPAASASTILGESDLTGTSSKYTSVTISYPLSANLIYAAAVDGDGRIWLKAFNPRSGVVDMSDAELSEVHTLPDYEAYTYLFEDCYPEPSEDWDFNDLVLRVSHLPSDNDHELKLRVSLCAVGTLNIVGAAINLINYQYDDIDSISTIKGSREGVNYNTNLPDQYRLYIKEEENLVKGRNNEAVINVMNDAHWGMVPKMDEDGTELGNVDRKYYNVHNAATADGSSQSLVPQVVTFTIHFKNPKLLNLFTLADLDVFMLKDFNGSTWEVHSYEHKNAAILKNQGRTAELQETNITPYALVIPTMTFRWPLEGVHIGIYKNGILSGAYQEPGHSFGEWAADAASARDWYFYPTTNRVY